jgi:hypothetical protein
MKISNKPFLIAASILFIIMFSLLYYSYLLKLGLLNDAIILFLILCAITVFLNLYIIRKDRKANRFWFFLAVAFTYAFFDKVFRIHIVASNILPIHTFIPTKNIIDFTYIIGFIVVNLFFYSYLKNTITDPTWIYLYVFAIFLKLIASFVDLSFPTRRFDDYVELFSLYFFTSGFLLKYINKKNDK